MQFRIRYIAYAINKVAEIPFLGQVEVVKKIHEHVIFLKRPKIEAEFRESLKTTDIKVRLDVPTRWNSTPAMLQSVFDRRAGIDEFLATQPDAVSQMMLEPEQWGQVDALEEATRACSGSDYPTLPLGILHLDMLPTLFQYVLADRSLVSNFSS